jgi:tetratricopeptide (TPR) repeat protein
LLYNKALHLAKSGKLEDALSYLDRALESDPADWMAMRLKHDLKKKLVKK